MDNTTFKEKVLAVVRAIPKGKVMSYGAVAKAAGFPGAARAVGTVMKNNYDPTVPCHRVVKANGSIGFYNRGGEIEKQRLLRGEGAI